MQHRIYFDGPLEAAEIAITGDEHHHAARVVRVREDEAVEIFDGRGQAVTGKVIELGRDSLRVRVTGPVESRESPLDIRLAMAIINLDKFELVLQKATELGVGRFIPMVTERVEVRPERYQGKSERWEKIVFEAVKQSGRAVIPSIDAPARFDEVISHDGRKIFFDADAGTSAPGMPDKSMTLLVGPEGGWTEQEIALARARNCTFMRIGPRRLRAETAAIAAAAIISARHGDI